MQSLYKYFKEEHAISFLKDGEILLRNFLWYKSTEDNARNDKLEGNIKFKFPTTINGKKIYNEAYSIYPLDNYFLFCCSTSLEPSLFRKYGNFCVHIEDQSEFQSRLTNAIKSMSFDIKLYNPALNLTLEAKLTMHCKIYGREVIYYDENKKIDVIKMEVEELPTALFSKRKSFLEDKEWGCPR